MEVPFSEAQESALSKLASDTGRQKEDLVQEAVDRMLNYDRWLTDQVQVGLEQIERGEFVGHDELRDTVRNVFRT